MIEPRRQSAPHGFTAQFAYRQGREIVVLLQRLWRRWRGRVHPRRVCGAQGLLRPRRNPGGHSGHSQRAAAQPVGAERRSLRAEWRAGLHPRSPVLQPQHGGHGGNGPVCQRQDTGRGEATGGGIRGLERLKSLLFK